MGECVKSARSNTSDGSSFRLLSSEIDPRICIRMRFRLTCTVLSNERDDDVMTNLMSLTLRRIERARTMILLGTCCDGYGGDSTRAWQWALV